MAAHKTYRRPYFHRHEGPSDPRWSGCLTPRRIRAEQDEKKAIIEALDEIKEAA